MSTSPSVKEQIEARVSLLRKVVSAPTLFLNDDVVRVAIKTQGNFAKLEYPAEDIAPMSLNTLKSYAHEWKVRGWDELNSLRLCAIEKIDSTRSPEESPNPGTKADLENRIGNLTEERNNALEDLALLTAAFHRAMRNARSYAKDSNRADIIQRCTEDESELLAMVSILHVKLGNRK